MTAEQTITQKSPNLDVLRSLAVLLVLYCHVLYYNGHGPIVGWSGLCGVGFFFVHTSLVLMWSLERDPHVWRFYLRRAFRLYPLWLVVLAAYLIFRIPASPIFTPLYGFHHSNAWETLQEALLVFNFFKGPTVVGASWTLPIELDMYLVLPFVYFFIRGTRTYWPLLVVSALVIAWDLANYPATTANLPMCAPYFMSGPIAYALTKRVGPRLPAWSFIPYLLVIAVVWSVVGTYQISWALTLLVGFSLPFFRQLRHRGLVRVAEQIAKYSYGIYLCHFISIVIAFHERHSWSRAGKLSVFVGSLALMSFLSFHLIEAPAIRWGKWLAERSTTLSRATIELEPAP